MPSGQSKVLTLVFTDLADSTGLKAQRGDLPVGELIARHRELITRLADECAGRIIDWAGDGCFLTFETSSAGVMFALRLQQAHAEDADLPGVRIGLHMGEVTEKEGPSGPDGPPRVEGLAVDLAARIQGLAKPGQVLMSSAVYHSARQRLGVEAFGAPILWQAYGDYCIKGFDDPLDICEAGLEGLSPLVAPEASEKAQPLVAVTATPHVEVLPPEAPSPLRRYAFIALFFAAVIAVTLGTDSIARLFTNDAPRPEGDPGSIKSLAVLPLVNLMNDPGQDYFVDGMMEAITAELAQIASLKVIARTSTTRYRNTELTAPEIGAELGVDGLIDGTVMRDGDDVRITVHLVDARSGMDEWAETYEATIRGVLQLQSNVALAIAQKVEAAVSPDESRRLAHSHEPNAEAYDKFLLGMYRREQAGSEDRVEAVRLFREATELDAEFAEAWAMLARALISLSSGGLRAGEDVAREARQAATRALEMDRDLHTVHVALGDIARLFDMDWEEADRRFTRAIELSPNDGRVRVTYASLLCQLGRNNEARGHVDFALDVDPEGAAVKLSAAGLYRMTGDWDKAEALTAEIMAEDPTHTLHLLRSANMYYEMGQYDRAIAQARRWVDIEPDRPEPQVLIALYTAAKGEIETSREMLAQILERFSDSFIPPGPLIRLAVHQGRIDDAFRYLRGAYEAKDYNALWFRVTPYHGADLDSPNWMKFRQDDRYWQLMDEMGFPPLPPEHPGYADEQAWLARKAAAAEASAPIKKLAVLPFENYSGDPEQDYFVNGMTEALITELAQIHSIQVRGRTSIMRYKDTDMSIPDIARELDVDGVIEGSVLREGDKVPITAQLIHAPSDTHRWADSFDSTVTSILELHSDMALAIAREVEANLTPQETSRIAEVRDVIPAAYDQVLLARQALNRQSREGFTAAERHARQAIGIDPNFAEAYSALATSLAAPTIWGWGNSAEPIAEVRSLLVHAQALDPNNASVLASTGWVALVYDHDWSQAWDSFQRAEALEPNSPWHHCGLVWCHLVAREFSAALDEAQYAVELDPYSALARDAVGDVYTNMGQKEQAIIYREETLQIFPDHLGTLMDLVFEYPVLGREAEFNRVVDNITAVGGNSIPWGFANGYAILGHADRARSELAEAERTESAPHPFLVAIGYAALGDAEKTFEWLNRAYEERQFNVIVLGTRSAPMFDPYRDDPRFQAILKKLNFPEPRPEYR